MRIRNYSERTIQTYLHSIEKVALHFSQPPGKITISQFKSYLYYLVNNQDASISRINQCISAWKILQQDILGREWEKVLIHRPRREKKLPVIITRFFNTCGPRQTGRYGVPRLRRSRRGQNPPAWTHRLVSNSPAYAPRWIVRRPRRSRGRQERRGSPARTGCWSRPAGRAFERGRLAPR